MSKFPSPICSYLTPYMPLNLDSDLSFVPSQLTSLVGSADIKIASQDAVKKVLELLKKLKYQNDVNSSFFLEIC